jgi:hypothetical protein
MAESPSLEPGAEKSGQENECSASEEATPQAHGQAHQINPVIDRNTGSVHITQVVKEDEADANTRLSQVISKQPILAWISIIVSIITLVIVAFVLGRVTTLVIQPTPASVAIVATTSAPNPAFVASQDLSEVQSQIQRLRDQVANLARQQTPVEWPAAVVTMILVISFLSLAGFLLARRMQSQDGPEKEGKGSGRRAGCIGWIALASAVLTAVFIPISQNLSAWVPTPVIPCLFEPDRCGYPKPTVAPQLPSGTLTVTSTPELTPSSDPSLPSTATALVTPTRLSTSTIPPTPSLTSEPKPDSTNVFPLYTPQPPVIINNYITCTSGKTVSSRVTCVTPTADP